MFKQNAFGPIICIEEASGFEPLFAHCLFTLDGSDTFSSEPEIVADNLLLVIDGQQRLQSFYVTEKSIRENRITDPMKQRYIEENIVNA